MFHYFLLPILLLIQYSISQTLQCELGWTINPSLPSECIRQCHPSLGLKFDPETSQCVCIETTFTPISPTTPEMNLLQENTTTKSILMCLPPNPCHNGYEARYYKHSNPNELATFDDPVDFDLDSVECSCNPNPPEEPKTKTKEFQQLTWPELLLSQDTFYHQSLLSNLFPSTLNEKPTTKDEKGLTKESPYKGRWCSIPKEPLCEPYCWPTRFSIPKLESTGHCAKEGCDCMSSLFTPTRFHDKTNYWGCECTKRNAQFENGCNVHNTHNFTFSTMMCSHTNPIDEFQIDLNRTFVPHKCLCQDGFSGPSCEYQNSLITITLISAATTSMPDPFEHFQNSDSTRYTLWKEFKSQLNDAYKAEFPTSTKILFVSYHSFDSTTKELTFEFWLGENTANVEYISLKTQAVTNNETELINNDDLYRIFTQLLNSYPNNTMTFTSTALEGELTYQSYFDPSCNSTTVQHEFISFQTPSQSCINNGKKPSHSFTKHYEEIEEISYQRNYYYISSSDGGKSATTGSKIPFALTILIVINIVLFLLMFGIAGLVYCRIHQLCCCKPKALYQEHEPELSTTRPRSSMSLGNY